jgi:ankyrin repeat protein
VPLADNDGATPVIIASENGHASVCDVLLSHGAQVNQADNDGTTPLFIASQNGHASVCDVLLSHGAQVNQAEIDDTTPLIIASQNGHASVCDLLLGHGAQVNQADNNGATPVFIASQNGHASVCDLLLSHGAQVNQADNVGTTPLIIASHNGHASVCDLLLSHGAQVNQANNDGTTSLYIASHNGHASVCDVLLSHGAQVNQADNDGATPLYIASQNGHASVCDVLLSHGAQVNQANKNGFTPLFISLHRGHVSVCSLLLPWYSSCPVIPLLNLPNDLILLILEHFSLDELFLFQRYVFSFFPPQPSSPSSHNPILSNLLRLFNHGDAHLFHRFQMPPRYLYWLGLISVRVKRLKLQDFNNQSLKYLKALTDSVKVLDFSASHKLTNEQLSQIGGCKFLTSLSLAHCGQITDNSLLKFLKLNSQLERLNISSTSMLTPQIISELGNCLPNLQHLDVSMNSWFDQNSLMLLVEHLPRLKSLDISHCFISTTSMIEFLKAKPGIQSIGYDAISPLLEITLSNDGGRYLLIQLAIRSIMSSDIDSQKIGFDNLHLLLQQDDGTLFEMIRSTGALKRITQSLSNPVSHPIFDLISNFFS